MDTRYVLWSSMRGTGRLRSRSLLHALLQAAVSSSSLDDCWGSSLSVSEGALGQVFDAGQASLLFRAARESSLEMPSTWGPRLQAADLCARVRYGVLVDTTAEIIDVCEEARIPVTLLKGISTSDQFYAVAHERPMRDVDLLIPYESLDAVERRLAPRGYRRSDLDACAFGGNPYHTPLHHDGRQVCVELHFELFPGNDPLRRHRSFNACDIHQASIASTFHGRPVRRLRSELQLVYIACYWLRDVTRSGLHASFVPPLLDAAYLLQSTAGALDWTWLIGLVDNEVAAASLYVLLTYLDRLGLAACSGDLLDELASRQRLLGRVDVKLIHAILDCYLVGDDGEAPRRWRKAVAATTLATAMTPGRKAGLLSVPWNLVFPPLVPDRYSFAFQRQRLARVLSDGR